MIMKSRKLIVPLIAIMVSAVALTGVVYALQSSVNDEGNTAPVTGSEFVLEVYKSDKTTILNEAITISDTNITITTAHTVGTSVAVSATPDIGSAYVGKIVVKNVNTGDNKVTIAPGAIADTVITSQAVGANSGSITLSMAIKIYTEETCQNEITNVATNMNTGVNTFYYKIVIEASGSFTFNNNAPVTDADAVYDALEDITFNMSFTATSSYVEPTP